MLLVAGRGEEKEFAEPPGIIRKTVCPLTGLLPGDRCPGWMEEVFIEGTEPRDYCPLSHEETAASGAPDRAVASFPSGDVFHIVFPADGDVFKIDPVLRPEFQSIRLRARVPAGSGVETVEWWINGRLAGARGRPYSLRWPLSPGSYIIRAVAKTGSGRLESREVKIAVIP
jgi:penicillin-binding protein 1C